LESTSKLEEPIVDRHREPPGHKDTHTQRAKKKLGPSFFTLSGGILRRDPRTSNRIDSMLSRMIYDSEPAEYSPHVDKNLDLLHTHLQLDMISIVAEDFDEAAENPLEEQELDRF